MKTKLNDLGKPTKRDRHKGQLIYNSIPSQVNEAEIFSYLAKNSINWEYLVEYKKRTGYTKKKIAETLQVSLETLRTYQESSNLMSRKVQIHLLSLLSLAKHGKGTFGTFRRFEQWLKEKNYYFDGKAPSVLLKSPGGIRFIDARLTALEYGDNV
jgi:hypothetical protein